MNLLILCLLAILPLIAICWLSKLLLGALDMLNEKDAEIRKLEREIRQLKGGF